jgi:hypothetical protein
MYCQLEFFKHNYSRYSSEVTVSHLKHGLKRFKNMTNIDKKCFFLGLETFLYFKIRTRISQNISNICFC